MSLRSAKLGDQVDGDEETSGGGQGAPQWGQPDFNAFFPVGEEGWFTPRKAARLWLTLVSVGDEYPDMFEMLDDRLPPIARGRGHVFLARMRRAALDLRADIESGRPPYPRSTGEALVLSWALREAIASADGDDDAGQEVANELLAHVARAADDSERPGSDLFELYDTLFEDLDFELMYSPEMDGIEQSRTGRQLGMESLRPEDWFEVYLTAKDLPERPYIVGAYEDAGVYTLNLKVSFDIQSAAAIKDAAVAHLRGDSIEFDSKDEQDAEIMRAEASVVEAIQTLIDTSSVLTSIPGAEEQRATFHVVEGDTLDGERSGD